MRSGNADRSFVTACVLLALAVVMSYALLWNATFVYDDLWTIVQNPAIQTWSVVGFFLDPKTVAAPGSGMALDIYRPLTTLSFAVDWHLWGMSPRAFHLINVSLHLLNGLLLGLWVYELFGKKLPAWVAAAVFLIHPAQVEVVAWVTQKSTLLCATGSLAALCILCRRGTLSKGWWLAGVAAWAAGLFSKETATMLPLVAFLADYLRLLPFQTEADLKHRRWMYVSWAVLALPYWLLRHSIIGGMSSIPFALKTWWVQLSLGMLAFPVYLAKLALPLALRVSYDTPRWNPFLVLGGGLCVLAAMGVFWVLLSRRHVLGLAIGSILFFLFPVLHVVPIVPYFSERFMYLPMIGLALAVAYTVENHATWRVPLAAWGIVLWGLTLVTIPVWKSEQSLWRKAVFEEPTNAFAQVCLAQSIGESPLAIPYYWKALVSRPSPIVRYAAMNNLATIYHQTGKDWQAHYWKQKALQAEKQLGASI